MYRPPISEWGLIISSATSGSQGATVTPGNNAYGTAAQLLAGGSVTDDAFAVLLNVSAMAVSGSARDALCKLTVGSTDVVVDLLVSCAGAYGGVGGSGITYYIPIRVQAGQQVSVAMSVNNAVVATASARCRLYCRPTHPEIIRTGTFVRTFGASLATSTGTAITPNSAGGKSAFVQLGSAAAEPLWGGFLGVGCNNSNMNNNVSEWDLSVGSGTGSNRPIIVDQIVVPSTGETLSYRGDFAYALVNAGDLLFARAGGQASSPTGMSAAAYLVGG